MVKVVAVSGGVDSMVLFDVALHEHSAGNLVVAHFNHGTRPSADDDEKFVQRVCKERGVRCEIGKCLLGADVSEETARKKRYEFLREVARKCGDGRQPAEILVAHHLDDLVESVAINLLRGTGWRGLTPMTQPGIQRPLLKMGWSRADVLTYAAEHGVAFRADPTNTDEKYLRNRVRRKLTELPLEKRIEIYHQMNILYNNQVEIRGEIREVMYSVIYSVEQYPRDWFRTADDVVGLELVRAVLEKAGVLATRPQMLDFLTAIRDYAPGKKFNLPGGKLVKIHKNYFML